jgi:hypothetical protein
MRQHVGIWGSNVLRVLLLLVETGGFWAMVQVRQQRKFLSVTLEQRRKKLATGILCAPAGQQWRECHCRFRNGCYGQNCNLSRCTLPHFFLSLCDVLSQCVGNTPNGDSYNRALTALHRPCVQIQSSGCELRFSQSWVRTTERGE